MIELEGSNKLKKKKNSIDSCSSPDVLTQTSVKVVWIRSWPFKKAVQEALERQCELPHKGCSYCEEHHKMWRSARALWLLEASGDMGGTWALV